MTSESIREGKLVPWDSGGTSVAPRDAGNFGKGTKKLLSAFTDMVEPIWSDGHSV